MPSMSLCLSLPSTADDKSGSTVPANAVVDESGNYIKDENGNYIVYE